MMEILNHQRKTTRIGYIGFQYSLRAVIQLSEEIVQSFSEAQTLHLYNRVSHEVAT
jgi:hypothetical protein